MIDDELLNEDDVESALSIAYVHAIAADAGYLCGEPPGPDRDSVDLQLSAGGEMRPKLDVQLKACMTLRGSTDVFNYPLKIKNYNDLRIPTQTPRILVVLHLPRERAQWMTITPDELVVRRAAYWVSLSGQPETTNSTSVTVSIPTRNIFNTDALRVLMERSRTGRVT